MAEKAMKKYDFDTVVDRKGTYSLKLEEMPAGAPEDALSLWVADMDFPCADPIIRAIHERADKLIFGYTVYSDDAVKGTVQKWFKKRYDWEVPKDDIFYSPGVVPALAILINILSEEGDGIVIQRPVYYPFTNKIESNGRKVVNNPLVYKDGKYGIDFADLEQKLAMASTKGMILCNPHNPVGRVWTEDELRMVLSICKKYDKWIISDEIHADIMRRDKTHIPLTKLADGYENIVICTAPSKTFNIAGMHMSNIIIHKAEYRARWESLIAHKLSIQLPSPFGVAALVAAYEESEDWLAQVNAYIDGNIHFCIDFIEKNLPKAKVVYPEATYLLWIDFSGYFDDYKELEKTMTQKAGVALDEGYIFGDEGCLFERINIAAPRTVIEECLHRIKNAILDS